MVDLALFILSCLVVAVAAWVILSMMLGATMAIGDALPRARPISDEELARNIAASDWRARKAKPVAPAAPPTFAPLKRDARGRFISRKVTP